jgi:hypothetical protein
MTRQKPSKYEPDKDQPENQANTQTKKEEIHNIPPN